MATTRRLSELVSDAISRLELPDGPVVVALSGGADSATLAMLCLEAGVETKALHIDHQLPGSPAMAEAARDVSTELGLPMKVETVTLDEGPSIEEKAREARYSVFEKSTDPLLTAHTRDDSVETILINMIRGTGPAGIAGIPRSRPPAIHRPMLAVTRAAAREIAMLARLPFRDDPMNEDLSLTRNRVRLQLLPLMRELNPDVDAALARAGRSVGRDSDYLDELVRPAYRDPLPISVLVTMPPVLADRLLHTALEEHGVGATSDRMERMWSVVRGDSDRQDLAGGWSVVRRGALLVVE